MARLYANNYTSTLAAAITNSATTVVVTNSTSLPTITGSDYYYLTIVAGGVYEIIKVTARTNETLTVVRAQESTTGRAWNAGTIISLRPTAESFTGNIFPNNSVPGFTTTVTAAGTTTLTSASTYYQFFTGTTTQNCDLPVTSTLEQGHPFHIVNNSTGIVTVRSSGGNTIQAMAAGTWMDVTCILTSGTGTSSWDAEYSSGSGGDASLSTVFLLMGA